MDNKVVESVIMMEIQSPNCFQVKKIKLADSGWAAFLFGSTANSHDNAHFSDNLHAMSVIFCC